MFREDGTVFKCSPAADLELSGQGPVWVGTSGALQSSSPLSHLSQGMVFPFIGGKNTAGKIYFPPIFLLEGKILCLEFSTPVYTWKSEAYSFRLS